MTGVQTCALPISRGRDGSNETSFEYDKRDLDIDEGDDDDRESNTGDVGDIRWNEEDEEEEVEWNYQNEATELKKIKFEDDRMESRTLDFNSRKAFYIPAMDSRVSDNWKVGDDDRDRYVRSVVKREGGYESGDGEKGVGQSEEEEQVEVKDREYGKKKGGNNGGRKTRSQRKEKGKNYGGDNDDGSNGEVTDNDDNNNGDYVSEDNTKKKKTNKVMENAPRRKHNKRKVKEHEAGKLSKTSDLTRRSDFKGSVEGVECDNVSESDLLKAVLRVLREKNRGGAEERGQDEKMAVIEKKNEDSLHNNANEEIRLRKNECRPWEKYVRQANTVVAKTVGESSAHKSMKEGFNEEEKVGKGAENEVEREVEKRMRTTSGRKFGSATVSECSTKKKISYLFPPPRNSATFPLRSRGRSQTLGQTMERGESFSSSPYRMSTNAGDSYVRDDNVGNVRGGVEGARSWNGDGNRETSRDGDRGRRKGSGQTHPHPSRAVSAPRSTSASSHSLSPFYSSQSPYQSLSRPQTRALNQPPFTYPTQTPTPALSRSLIQTRSNSESLHDSTSNRVVSRTDRGVSTGGAYRREQNRPVTTRSISSDLPPLTYPIGKGGMEQNECGVNIGHDREEGEEREGSVARINDRQGVDSVGGDEEGDKSDMSVNVSESLSHAEGGGRPYWPERDVDFVGPRSCYPYEYNDDENHEDNHFGNYDENRCGTRYGSSRNNYESSDLVNVKDTDIKNSREVIADANFQTRSPHMSDDQFKKQTYKKDINDTVKNRTHVSSYSHNYQKEKKVNKENIDHNIRLRRHIADKYEEELEKRNNLCSEFERIGTMSKIEINARRSDTTLSTCDVVCGALCEVTDDQVRVVRNWLLSLGLVVMDGEGDMREGGEEELMIIREAETGLVRDKGVRAGSDMFATTPYALPRALPLPQTRIGVYSVAHCDDLVNFSGLNSQPP